MKIILSTRVIVKNRIILIFRVKMYTISTEIRILPPVNQEDYSYYFQRNCNYTPETSFPTPPPRRAYVGRVIIPSLLGCEGLDCSEGES